MTAATTAPAPAPAPAPTDDGIVRKFSRAELATALTAAGRPWIAESMYAIRPEGGYLGERALALDFDDSADLGVFIVVVSRLLDGPTGLLFAASGQTGMPAHPDGLSTTGIRSCVWAGFSLEEMTKDEWDDDRADCAACSEDEECGNHQGAPWQAPAPLEAIAAVSDAELALVP